MQPRTVMHHTVREFMTREPRCIAVGQSVHRARQIMQAAGIRHLPVLDGEVVVGIVTERDIRLLETCGRAGTDVPVQEAMTPDPFIVSPDATLSTVSRALAQHKFGSAVVMEQSTVLGIFTMVDACNALAQFLESLDGPPSCDRWGNVIENGEARTSQSSWSP